MWYASALVLGVVSSLHCLVMCGPIAMVVPKVGSGSHARTLTAVLYNSGRLFTYSLLGLLIAMVGRSAALAGLQQSLSITLGVLVLLVYFGGKWFTRYQPNSYLQRIFLSYQNQFMARFRKRSYGNIFKIGMLNGLLPCGMVYLALAGAVNSQNAGGGALFMALFGLGTLPAMVVPALFSTFSVQFTTRLRKHLVPAVVILFAAMLLLRGANLGIPYLSPALIESGKGAVEGCTAR